MDSIVFTAIGVIGAIALIALLMVKEGINSRINALTFEIDALIAENSMLMRRMNALDIRTIEVADELASYEPTEFEKRIEEFKRELNEVTYADNDAPVQHPSVYNVPHGEIEDVPLREEEEYAV